jgi:hypothetical protein
MLLIRIYIVLFKTKQNIEIWKSKDEAITWGPFLRNKKEHFWFNVLNKSHNSVENSLKWADGEVELG